MANPLPSPLTKGGPKGGSERVRHVTRQPAEKEECFSTSADSLGEDTQNQITVRHLASRVSKKVYETIEGKFNDHRQAGVLVLR